jgi:M6 family metalloprotease-like protein
VFSRVSRVSLVTIMVVCVTIVSSTSLSSVVSEKVPVSLPLAAVNGPQKTVVILVRFSDQSNTTKPSQVDSTLSTMNNYYYEDSFGTTSFQTSITPNGPAWYTLPSPMSYYGTDTASADNQLVDDGLRAAFNSGVDLSQFKFATLVHAGNDEAMTHVVSDIHSFTIQGYIFSTGPLTSIKISTSVVAESDPVGVYAHESGHLLGLPDLYDVTGTIDPTNNFLGYWEIMALGEWNPNNGLPCPGTSPCPGTYPALHSAWSKIQLGWLAGGQNCGPTISGVCTVQSGTAANITLQNLEQPGAGIQAVKIPIAYNKDGTMTYYLLEMRAKLGTYDRYLPFPSTYPDAGLLIYLANESIPTGHGSLRLIDAHPGGGLDDAPFGPCFSPCVSENTFSDQPNYVKVIITSTSTSAYSITVDRTAAPALLLQINTSPGSSGVLVSVDGVNNTSDSTGQVRLPVRYGPHTIYVQPRIPLTVGSTTVTVGLANAFASWDDGATTNPRGVSVVRDTVLTAIYRVTVEPSIPTALLAVGIFGIILTAISLHHHRNQRAKARLAISQEQVVSPAPTVVTMRPESSEAIHRTDAHKDALFPGNDGLSGQSVDHSQTADSSKA